MNMMMKITTALILVWTFSLYTFAQDKNELKSDLVKDKRKVLAKYIPIGKGDFLHRFYVMPSDEVLAQLEKFKADIDMTAQVDAETNPEVKNLMRKDIEYYAGQVLDTYVNLYGMDSLGTINLMEVGKKKNDTNYKELMAEAEKKAFVKTMELAERERLMEIVNKNGTLDDEALYKRSESYRSWVVNRIHDLRISKYKADKSLGFGGMAIANLEAVKGEVPAGFMQDQLNYRFTKDVLKMVKDSAAIQHAYQNFLATSNNEAHKNEVKTIYENFKMMAANSPSPDFEYIDINGKMIFLSSLRGKYVYIDVWATWCAPCKAEIPSLQEIEHDYQGKNIEFVSLSVDRVKDKDKWIAYVKDNNLGGIQVIADKDFSSDFVKKYNIGSIPRFILIDPKGNIVSGDAYRPSDLKLRQQLDSLLN